MKLYHLPRGKWFRLLEDTQAPPDIGGYEANRVMKLGNIDGMYSFCTDEHSNVYHPAAWSEVEMVSDPL
jgi:hypothetical protein